MLLWNWAMAKGYCLLAKGESISGREVKELYPRLSRVCGKCGSLDTAAGGELTLNAVGDITDGCSGMDIPTGIYESGLCGGIFGNL
jgi:hypothetical protein